MAEKEATITMILFGWKSNLREIKWQGFISPWDRVYKLTYCAGKFFIFH